MIAKLRKYGRKKRKNGVVLMRVLAVTTINPDLVIIGNGHQKITQNFVLLIPNVLTVNNVMAVRRVSVPV